MPHSTLEIYEEMDAMIIITYQQHTSLLGWQNLEVRRCTKASFFETLRKVCESYPHATFQFMTGSAADRHHQLHLS